MTGKVARETARVETLWFRRLAPAVDAAFLILFVAIGRDQHHLGGTGVKWYLMVLWPLAVGWIVGALAMKLYTRVDHAWLRLLGTIAIGVFIQAVLRAAFTGRPWFSVFSIVSFIFLSLVTFGWRLVWVTVARLRRPAAAT